MSFDLFSSLGLRRAGLADLGWANDEERQPQRRQFVLPLAFNSQPSSENAPLDALSDWRRQEPVERLVNTILLCAIRDGASFVVIEPQNTGVQVRFGVEGTPELLGSVIEREHLRLPFLTLEPIVTRIKGMALGSQDREALEDREFQGSFEVRVNEGNYLLHVSTQPTTWGERIEVRFSFDSSQ